MNKKLIIALAAALACVGCSEEHPQSDVLHQSSYGKINVVVTHHGWEQVAPYLNDTKPFSLYVTGAYTGQPIHFYSRDGQIIYVTEACQTTRLGHYQCQYGALTDEADFQFFGD